MNLVDDADGRLAYLSTSANGAAAPAVTGYQARMMELFSQYYLCAVAIAPFFDRFGSTVRSAGASG